MSWTKRDPKRSYQCDGTQLKKIRSSRGWSQRLLAQKAGYSERLISKAEANGQVTVDALEILAQTLTTDAEPVFPEDLIGSPEGLARSFSYAVYHLQNKMFDFAVGAIKLFVNNMELDISEEFYMILFDNKKLQKKHFDLLYHLQEPLNQHNKLKNISP